MSDLNQPAPHCANSAKLLVLLTDKPVITRNILPAIRKAYPGWAINTYHMMLRGPLAFKWPRGLSWDNYPFVGEPGYRADLQHNFMAMRFDSSGDRGRSIGNPWAAMYYDLQHCDDLFICVDPSETIQSGVELLLKELAPKRFGCRTILSSKALYGDVVTEEIERGLTFPAAAEDLINAGHVKRWFDYNYNLNSLAIHGKALRVALHGHVIPKDTFLSKYALQTLYHIRDLGQPVTDGDLLYTMHNWRGTGRYDKKCCGLGSPASRAEIIRQLQDLLLVDRKTTPYVGKDGEQLFRSVLSLSDNGCALLDILHPDSCDPDLPFRLAKWIAEGDLAKPAMARYIKTFFGKTKLRL